MLATGLAKRGAEVDEVVVYRAVSPDRLPPAFHEQIEKNAIDLVTFTSSSTAQNLSELLTHADLAGALGRLPAACIGPVTAQTAKPVGLKIFFKLDEASVSIIGLVNAICHYFE